VNADVTPNTPTWYVRRATLPSGLHLVSAHRGDEFPDGSTMHDGHPALWSTEPSENGLLRVIVAQASVPDAPSTWFVNVDEPRAMPPAANLVAYATDDFPAGTVVNKFQFGSLGLPSEEQAGAVRWFRDGLVHQVFVAPKWRRKQLGTLLIYAASAFHQANGWQGKLHGDGRYTDLGNRFLENVPHAARIPQLTEPMPPMDPVPDSPSE
jgi:GNAT superfamily N-acetyltransferase